MNIFRKYKQYKLKKLERDEIQRLKNHELNAQAQKLKMEQELQKAIDAKFEQECQFLATFLVLDFPNMIIAIDNERAKTLGRPNKIGKGYKMWTDKINQWEFILIGDEDIETTRAKLMRVSIILCEREWELMKLKCTRPHYSGW